MAAPAVRDEAIDITSEIIRSDAAYTKYCSMKDKIDSLLRFHGQRHRIQFAFSNDGDDYDTQDVVLTCPKDLPKATERRIRKLLDPVGLTVTVAELSDDGNDGLDEENKCGGGDDLRERGDSTNGRKPNEGEEGGEGEGGEGGEHRRWNEVKEVKEENAGDPDGPTTIIFSSTYQDEKKSPTAAFLTRAIIK
ncbi:hypothetical protein H0H81_006889, partial [Sphagnurus paluster]